ncbi:MAG: twin-arginine translocase TatA/TatE family subunit [Marmoricola sp.]
MLTPLLAGLGMTELLIILGVVILLFGAAKLPELARGTGQALRIFKAETKGLIDDDKPGETTADKTAVTPEQRDIDARAKAEQEHRTEPGA